MRRWVDLLVLTVLTLLAVELVLRAVEPATRRTVVREAMVGGFHTVSGVTTWVDDRRDAAANDRIQGPHCFGADAFRVLVLGDSILNGIALDPADTPGAQLEARLQRWAGARRVCVSNLSVPGFVTLQSLARGEAVLDALRPHAVVLESFASSQIPARWGEVVIPSCGTPDDPWLGNPWHVPGGVHAALLSRSRVYVHAVAAWPDCVGAFGLPDWLLARAGVFEDRVSAGGGQLFIVLPVHLDRSNAEGARTHAQTEAAWRRWAEGRSTQVLRFIDWLPDENRERLRIDPVHLSAEGVHYVADGLAEAMRPALERWLASPGDGTPPP